MILAASSNSRSRFAAGDTGVRLGLPVVTATYGRRTLLRAINGALVMSSRLTRSGGKPAYPIKSVGESVAEVACRGAGR
jgi:hypothetical protein